MKKNVLKTCASVLVATMMILGGGGLAVLATEGQAVALQQTTSSTLTKEQIQISKFYHPRRKTYLGLVIKPEKLLDAVKSVRIITEIDKNQKELTRYEGKKGRDYLKEAESVQPGMYYVAGNLIVFGDNRLKNIELEFEDFTFAIDYDTLTVHKFTRKGDTPAVPEPEPSPAPGEENPEPSPGGQDALAKMVEESDFLYAAVASDRYIQIVSKLSWVALIDGVELRGQRLEKKNMLSIVGQNGYFLQAEENRIYLPSLNHGNIVKLYASGNRVIATLQYDAGTNSLTRVHSATKEKLQLKILGSFRPALVGEEKYDAISGATSGGSSENRDSEVRVLATLKENPKEADWKPLGAELGLPVEKARVVFLQRGTEQEVDTGMRGRIVGEELKLSQRPTRAGKYEIQVQYNRNGKIYQSNVLPFRVFSNDENLHDRLREAQAEGELKTLPHGGKLSWDMAPYEIRRFGGQNESVTSPQDLKLWWGSHTSGTYGYLGTSKLVQPEEQTLIVPSGADLTFVNMILRSNVTVIVENGAKLNLQDSVAYGKIIVQSGGSFQMNYDVFHKKFLSGSSINGQLLLKKGAQLGDSLIYSNTNFVTDAGKNGKANRNEAPVVVVEGDIEIAGKVFIRGDESATGMNEHGLELGGQPALEVKAGATVTLKEGAILATYGGGRDHNATNHRGGTALLLDGNIQGEGRLIAIGGAGNGKNGVGGTAVTGTGRLDTAEAYLAGGNTSMGGQTVGKAYADSVQISGKVKGEAKPGKVKTSSDEPQRDDYWSSVKEPEPHVSNPFADGQAKNPIVSGAAQVEKSARPTAAYVLVETATLETQGEDEGKLKEATKLSLYAQLGNQVPSNTQLDLEVKKGETLILHLPQLVYDGQNLGMTLTLEQAKKLGVGQYTVRVKEPNKEASEGVELQVEGKRETVALALAAVAKAPAEVRKSAAVKTAQAQLDALLETQASPVQLKEGVSQPQVDAAAQRLYRSAVIEGRKLPLRQEVARQSEVKASEAYLYAKEEQKTAYDQALQGGETLLAQEELTQVQASQATLHLQKTRDGLQGKKPHPTVKPNPPQATTGKPDFSPYLPHVPERGRIERSRVQENSKPKQTEAKKPQPIQMKADPQGKNTRPTETVSESTKKSEITKSIQKETKQPTSPEATPKEVPQQNAGEKPTAETATVTEEAKRPFTLYLVLGVAVLAGAAVAIGLTLQKRR